MSGRSACDDVLAALREQARPENVPGMARFGINPQNTLGISVPMLRRYARSLGRDHALALDLWASGVHEARILAALVEEPGRVTPEQMDVWVADLDSWDVCDHVCGNLFDRTPYAFDKVAEWSRRDEEFVRRAAFALLAELAVHDKRAPDERFLDCFPFIVSAATGDRNYVKKAVNWALRQIGKRNPALNTRAIELAHEIQRIDARSARWIAADALRELTGSAVQDKLRR
jgi:3-methyladenine DNA glycosylase AlkD